MGTSYINYGTPDSGYYLAIKHNHKSIDVEYGKVSWHIFKWKKSKNTLICTTVSCVKRKTKNVLIIAKTYKTLLICFS